MTHKQWFNNVLHLHPVPKERAEKLQTEYKITPHKLFQLYRL